VTVLDPMEEVRPNFLRASFCMRLSNSLLDGIPERASSMISTRVFWDSSFLDKRAIDLIVLVDDLLSLFFNELVDTFSLTTFSFLSFFSFFSKYSGSSSSSFSSSSSSLYELSSSSSSSFRHLLERVVLFPAIGASSFIELC